MGFTRVVMVAVTVPLMNMVAILVVMLVTVFVAAMS
jgi:hypothetical protein